MASSPLLTVAPMEGLTGVIFRQVHSRFFGGADQYYIPFVTPTTLPKFTERQLRELAPEVNAGFEAVPQLLTRRTEDFIWAAKALADLGYTEVNLNLGCPAGTVVAKGKGSGFLRTPNELQQFLDTIFNADLGIDVSVKTRVGWSDEAEFDLLTDVYNHFPMKVLIVHPRLKTDMYRGKPRKDLLDRYAATMKMPLGYNGDLVTPADIETIQERYTDLQQIMVGRALMADPALFRKAKGGESATREEIVAFSNTLFEAYATAFESRNNALMRMKEYWFYQLNLFKDSEKPGKNLFKSKTPEAFFEALKPVVEELEVLQDARFGWEKPL